MSEQKVKIAAAMKIMYNMNNKKLTSAKLVTLKTGTEDSKSGREHKQKNHRETGVCTLLAYAVLPTLILIMYTWK